MRRYFIIWLITFYVLLTSAQNVVAADQKVIIDSVERNVKSVNWIRLEHTYTNNQIGRTITIEPNWMGIKIGSVVYKDILKNDKWTPDMRTVKIEPSVKIGPQWVDFKIGSIKYNDIYNNKYSASSRLVDIKPQWKDFTIGSLTYHDIYNNKKYSEVGRIVDIGPRWKDSTLWSIKYNNAYTNDKSVIEKNFNIGPFKWKGTYDTIKGTYSITYIPNRPISSYNNRNYFPYNPTPFEIMQRENYLKYGCCRMWAPR